MKAIRLSLFFCAAMLGTVPSVRAQEPADRKALQELRDSLRGVTDSAALRAVETRTIEMAKRRRDDAVIHVRLGLIALRLNELGSAKHLGYAQGEFQWALELQPEWPWPWLGMGLADRRSPGASRYAGGLFSMLGLDGESKASEAFARSISADSNFYEGLLNLSDMAEHQKINAPVGGALDALRLATRRSPSIELLLARARLERLANNADSALRVFNQARTQGGPEALIWLELARTIPLASPGMIETLAMPRVDSAYFLGAASDDSGLVALYRGDLEPILEDSLLAQFDAVKGKARVEWLRKFWQTRDQLDLRPSGSRLSEHFRRWDIVRRDFPLTPYRRRYAQGLETYRSGNKDIDDRGIVLLRHGSPTQRIVWPHKPRGPNDTLARFAETDLNGFEIRLGQSKLQAPATKENYGNETWVYKRPDGDVILHFAANFDPEDYRLQANAMGLDVSFNEMLHTIYGGAALPGLRKLLEATGANADLAMVDERLRGRRDNTLATSSDSWFREYRYPLPGRSGWFAAGESGGQPLVHLIYALDANAISAEPWKQVPVNIRATFLDADGKIVATLDTLEVVTRPQVGTTVVAVRAQVALPPGAQRVRLGVELTPDRGVVHRTDTLRLPRVDGGQLDISDILIGRRGRSLEWAATPSDTAWLDPLMTYRLGDTLQVYAESYGVKAGEQYTVQLTLTRRRTGVTKLLGGRDAAITLGERVTFPGPVGIVRRSVSLTGLEAGDYQMEISVSGKNGKVTTQRRVYIGK